MRRLKVGNRINKITSTIAGLSVAIVMLVASPVQAATGLSGAVSYLSGQYQAGTLQPASFAMGEADWAAIAFAAEGSVDSSTLADPSIVTLKDYVTNETTTAYGRKIMALNAVAADTSTTEANLLATFDGSQFGSTNSLTEDIFAIMAASVTTNSSLQLAAAKAATYLIANQNTDGGFGYAIGESSDSNDTASAIVALAAAGNMGTAVPKIESPINDALGYLLTTQDLDGGFRYDLLPDWGGAAQKVPDADSTSWAIIALNTFGSEFSVEVSDAKTWLTTAQNSDGGFHPSWTSASNNYSTAQAVIALSDTSWLLGDTPYITFVTEPTPTPPPAPTPTPVAGTDTTPTNTTYSSVTKPISSKDNGYIYEPTTVALADTTTDQPAPVPKEPTGSNAETKLLDDSSNKTISASKTSNWTKLGYGLTAVAIGGFMVYAFMLRRKNEN